MLGYRHFAAGALAPPQRGRRERCPSLFAKRTRSDHPKSTCEAAGTTTTLAQLLRDCNNKQVGSSEIAYTPSPCEEGTESGPC